MFNFITEQSVSVVSFSIDKSARLVRRIVIICERKRVFILFTDDNIRSTCTKSVVSHKNII